MKSAEEMARQCQESDPGRWAYAKTTAVGYWHDGTWCVFAVKSIACEWLVVPSMPLVNGEPVYKETDWIEIRQGERNNP